MLFKDVRVDHRSFMSKVFGAFIEMLSEIVLGKGLKIVAVSLPDAVPVLGSTHMDIIGRV